MNKEAKFGSGAFKMPFSPEDPIESLVSVAPGILIKSQQETVEVVEKWLPYLNKLSDALLKAKMSTPEAPYWLVSSIQSSFFGEPRIQAQSHATGNALDLAPIYGPASITAPDRSTPSMATDLIKLARIAQLKVEGLFIVVEGDHLHIVCENDPIPDKLVSYPTLIPWYNAGHELEGNAVVAPFLEKFFGFSAGAGCLCPLTKDEVRLTVEALTAYSRKKAVSEEAAAEAE